MIASNYGGPGFSLSEYKFCAGFHFYLMKVFELLESGKLMLKDLSREFEERLIVCVIGKVGIRFSRSGWCNIYFYLFVFG